MGEQKKVWLVTAGCYSDYRVVTVFSTREKAEAFRGGDAIEEHWLDMPSDGVPHVAVTMSKEGKTFEATKRLDTYIFPRCSWVFPGPPYRFDAGKGSLRDALCIRVQTDDVERAIKVVNEKRSRILALNLWGDDRGLEV